MLGECLLIVVVQSQSIHIPMETPVTETACAAAGYALIAIMREPPHLDARIGYVWKAK